MLENIKLMARRKHRIKSLYFGLEKDFIDTEIIFINENMRDKLDFFKIKIYVRNFLKTHKNI